MGLMFARRRIKEAQRRAADKAATQQKRHAEARNRQKQKDAEKAPESAPEVPSAKDVKNGSESGRTK